MQQNSRLGRALWRAILVIGTVAGATLMTVNANAAFDIAIPFNTATALTQKGALNRGPNVNLCGGFQELAKSEPFQYFDNDTTTGHPYQVYDVYNPGPAGCREVTISWQNGDCSDPELAMFVYNGTFNPNDITQNFLGGSFGDNRGKGKIDSPGTDASQYRYSPGFDRHGGFLGQDYHTDWMPLDLNVPAFAHLQVVIVAKRKSTDAPVSCDKPILYSDDLSLAPVGFTVDDTQAFEGGVGDSAKLSFPIRLGAILNTTVSVQWSTANGIGANGGVAGVDYTTASGTATFLPGQDVKYVDVPIIGNATVQVDRTVRLVLSNPSPSGVPLVRSTAVGTIIDDDTPSCRFTEPATVPNGTVGVPYGPVKFTPTGADAVSDYGITVKAGSSLPPGVAFEVVDMAGDINAYGQLLGTPQAAGSYTFTLDLVCPLLEGGQDTYSQTYTILIDNGLPKVFVTLPDAQKVEGNGGLTPVTMTVSLSAAQQTNTVFTIKTVDAVATTADNDYVAISNQQVTVLAGALSANFTVNIRGDITPESNEQFLVQLFHTTGTQELAASAIVTIINDDVLQTEPPPAIPALMPASLVVLALLMLAVVALRFARVEQAGASGRKRT